VSWEQQGSVLTLESTQATSSTLTPLFKMSMEYTFFHEGGDTTIRVYHDENVESYQFDLPFVVNDIGIDFYNQVLDGEGEEMKSASAGENTPMFSIAPNPSGGTFLFSLNEEVGIETGDDVILEVLDLTGKTLFRSMYRGCLPFMEYAVELEEPVTGIYFVRFLYKNRVEVQKLLVK
jgi:hypothetical protein